MSALLRGAKTYVAQPRRACDVDGRQPIVVHDCCTANVPKVVSAPPRGQASGMITKGLGCTLGDVMAQLVSGEAANAVYSIQLGLHATLLDAPLPPTAAAAGTARYRTSSHRQRATQYNIPAPALPMWMPATICLTAALLRLLNGQPELIMSSCQDKLVSLTAANYLLWPLTQFLNANIIPKQHQSKTNLLIHMVWSACLSGLGHAPCVISLNDIHAVPNLAGTAIKVASQAMPQQATSAASHALHGSAELTAEVMSPLLDCAAQAVGAAVRKLEAVPSTLTQEAISKSLDVIMNVEEMAKSPLHIESGSLVMCSPLCCLSG